MLSSVKLKNCRESHSMSVAGLAAALVGTGVASGKEAQQLKKWKGTIKNWEKGLFRPQPKRSDIDALARAMEVERQDLLYWSAKHMYAPMAPRKVRLVTQLIQGRTVQDALDVLKFANKRAAVMVDKVLRSAVANADEQEADVERLYIAEARVDEGGVRRGTKRWRPKDRGRAVSFTRLASHIHISLDVE